MVFCSIAERPTAREGTSRGLDSYLPVVRLILANATLGAPMKSRDRNNGRNGEPAYRRIQTAIRKRIETTELRPGDIVESERELA